MARKSQGKGPTLDVAGEKGKGAAKADKSSAPAGRKKQALMRQSAVAPRVEPSTRGANQWVSGRRQKRKTS